MEYGVSTATLSDSKKLQNGVRRGFSGKSAYDGVFAIPVKFKPSALLSRVEDYSEIFGGSEASRGSSIPILEVPEINKRNVSIEFRPSSAKLDYSKVFGGVGDLDTAVSYEELLGQPKRKTSLPKQQRAPEKRRSPSNVEDFSIHASNDPAVCHEVSYQFDGPKKISVSYNKIDQGDRNGTRSTTYISQLHAIPGYTCLVDEISSVKGNRANGHERSVPNFVHCDDSLIENVRGRKAYTRANSTPPDAKTQCPTSSLKVHKSDRCLSDLNTGTIDEHAIDNGTWQMKMSKPETLVRDSDKQTSSFKRSDNKVEVSNGDASESRNGTYSPPELADFMDSNSEAAASVAALKKAIEEAQEKLKLAKESTRRRKEGFKDCVKIKHNVELRRGENVGSVANRIDITKEMKPQTIHEEMRDSVQILSEIERKTGTEGVAAADLIDRKVPSITEEAGTETMKEYKTTQGESKLVEMELKEEDIFYEFADTGRPDETKLESEQFYESVDPGNFEETELDSEQVANMVTGAHAIDGCEENEEKKHVNNFDWLDEGRKTVKAVGKDLRQDKTEIDVDPGNGPCEHENFRNEFGSVQDMQHYEGNENRLSSLDKQNGPEKKLDLHEHEDYESILLKPTEKNCISQFWEENDKSVKVFLAEQCERDLRVLDESVVDEKIIARVQTKNLENDACGFEELQEKIDNDILSEPQELHLDSQIETQNQIENGGETSILDGNEDDQEYTCKEDDIVKSFDNVCKQEIVEETVDVIRADEENVKRHGGGDFDESKMVREDKKDENLLNAVTTAVKENSRESKGTIECAATSRNGTSTHESNADENTNVLEDVSNHVNNNDERLNLSDLDETEILTDEIKSTIFSQKETLIYMELSYELGDVLQATSESFQSKENCERSETFQRMNNLERTHERLGMIQGSPRISVPENLVGAVPAETAEKNINMPAEQNEDECVDAADTVCNLVELEELSPDIENLRKNTNESDVSIADNVDESHDAFSSERLVGSENNVEVVTESPTLSEQDPDANELHEIKTSKNGEDIKENDQTTLRMEEGKNDNTNDNLHKVELEKERLKRIEEAREREREREREKEKLAVERAFADARERLFVDACERAERERATTKARHRMITESREKQGKNASQVNDKSIAEKAALEAKLKAEHAAVERATSEARAHALKRAVSEKALSEERNKDAQHSTSWSSSTFTYTRTPHYGDTHSSEELGMYDGESSQRCKAISERHQRVMERAAKALAEKSMRDHLAQKEQEERNRLAEALDADIKRWSSGKEGNLRALLSTLHYILGPTSGWQAIPLTDIVTATAVKKAYRKATLFVHPDKLQQRGASIQRKYTCEKVFDLLKEAWNRFNVEER